MPPAPSHSASEEEQRISAEITALHGDVCGSPVQVVGTHVVDDIVVCLITLPLLTVERTLIDGGARHDDMRDHRRQLEQSLRPGMVAAVEHTTGREVIAFFTDAQLEPPLTIDVFRLAPAEA
jgi:uncharacterized protein YbcI